MRRALGTLFKQDAQDLVRPCPAAHPPHFPKSTQKEREVYRGIGCLDNTEEGESGRREENVGSCSRVPSARLQDQRVTGQTEHRSEYYGPVSGKPVLREELKREAF